MLHKHPHPPSLDFPQGHTSSEPELRELDDNVSSTFPLHPGSEFCATSGSNRTIWGPHPLISSHTWAPPRGEGVNCADSFEPASQDTLIPCAQ